MVKQSNSTFRRDVVLVLGRHVSPVPSLCQPSRTPPRGWSSGTTLEERGVGGRGTFPRVDGESGVPPELRPSYDASMLQFPAHQ